MLPTTSGNDLRKEFGRKLDDLQELIAYSLVCLAAWQGLVTEDKETVGAVNRYYGFFKPAYNALNAMALLQLAKVFDTDRRTVSLRNLLREVQANRTVLTPRLSEQELGAIEAMVQQRESTIKSLKHLRDTRLAHQDAIVATSMPLLYGEVLKLIEDVKTMYQMLRKGYDGNSMSFDNMVGRAGFHTSEVVRIVCEERDRGQQRIKEADKLIEAQSSEGGMNLPK